MCDVITVQSTITTTHKIMFFIVYFSSRGSEFDGESNGHSDFRYEMRDVSVDESTIDDECWL